MNLSVSAVFCCVGALAISGNLHRVDKDSLGWWLCERQHKSGGLNGRPEKQPDASVKTLPNQDMIPIVLNTLLIVLVTRFAILGGCYRA